MPKAPDPNALPPFLIGAKFDAKANPPSLESQFNSSIPKSTTSVPPELLELRKRETVSEYATSLRGLAQEIANEMDIDPNNIVVLRTSRKNKAVVTLYFASSVSAEAVKEAETILLKKKIGDPSTARTSINTIGVPGYAPTTLTLELPETTPEESQAPPDKKGRTR